MMFARGATPDGATVGDLLNDMREAITHLESTVEDYTVGKEVLGMTYVGRWRSQIHLPLPLVIWRLSHLLSKQISSRMLEKYSLMVSPG